MEKISVEEFSDYQDYHAALEPAVIKAAQMAYYSELLLPVLQD